MTDKRYQVGIGVTVIYVVALGIYAVVQRGPVLNMTPNEFGDALAGAASPLAFLWLVLGYLQQGDELRQNTDALRLQAEELKNSVKQQAGLVELGRQQLSEERARYAASVRPRFYLETYSVTRGAMNLAWVISLTNVGAKCTQILMAPSSNMFTLTNAKLDALESLQKLEMRLEAKGPEEVSPMDFELWITYVSRDAVREQVRYPLRLEGPPGRYLHLRVLSQEPTLYEPDNTPPDQ